MKKIKMVSLLFIVTVLAVFCFAVSVSAEWEKVSEDSNIEYHFDAVTGTLYIKGEGKIPDDFLKCCDIDDFGQDAYDYICSDGLSESGEIVMNESFVKVRTLIIEEGITEIGHCAFMGEYRFIRLMYNLETVIFPDSLEVIGNYAFQNCQKLTKVYWSSNLKKIGNQAFLESGITKLDIPETLETIGSNAFAGTSLKKVYVPENVTTIGSSAFNDCDSLKKITFTNATCLIRGCGRLTSIVYPETPDAVDEIAVNCNSLKEVIFKNITSKNKVKISVEDSDKFLPACPDAVLGYLDASIIPALDKNGISYAVITESVSKLGKIKTFKHTKTGSADKLKWSAVDGAGYYKLYYWNGEEWERVYCGSMRTYSNPAKGRYRVRAVNCNGKKYVYGKYTYLTVK